MLKEEAARYRTLDFYARQVVEGFITGRHRSPFHGFSAEFSDYRQYNNGESTRNIDWRLYGRTDKLFVKRFEEETNLRCELVVDHSSSMYFPVERQGDLEHPNKLTFAACGAAVLSELMLRQRDAFGLTLMADGIEKSLPCRSSSAHQRILVGELEQMIGKLPAEPQRRTTRVAESLHLLAEEWHRRSLVVLFTDALLQAEEREAFYDALRHLRHNKHEVIVFHILDYAHEVRLDYGTAPVRFVDLESGRELKVSPTALADAYRSEMERTTSELRQRMLQYHTDYVPIDVGEGFHAMILPFLLKRSKVV